MNERQSVGALRIAVRVKIVKADLGRHDLKRIVLPKISEKLGRPVHHNSMYNALAGYRDGHSSREILTAMDEIMASLILDEQEPQSSACVSV